MWNAQENYSIHVKARDSHYFESSWSDSYNVSIIGNRRPSSPMINGPTSGKENEIYEYTFVSDDVDFDQLFYKVDWGDGTFNDWFGPYSSSEKIILNHTFYWEGSIIIKAKARDIYGAESDWATLEVSIPKSKNKLDWPYYECIIWGRIRNPQQEIIPPYGKVLRLYAKAVHVIGINIGFGGGIVNERYRCKEIIVPYKDFKGTVTDRRIIGQFDSGWIPTKPPEKEPYDIPIPELP